MQLSYSFHIFECNRCFSFPQRNVLETLVCRTAHHFSWACKSSGCSKVEQRCTHLHSWKAITSSVFLKFACRAGYHVLWQSLVMQISEIIFPSTCTRRRIGMSRKHLRPTEILANRAKPESSIAMYIVEREHACFLYLYHNPLHRLRL